MIYRIEQEVFEQFPGACRAIVVAKGIDNSRPNPELASLLQSRVEAIRDNGIHTDHERIRAWEETYRRFGANPKKHTPSIGYLVKRIKSGKPVSSISPVVDLLNYISLSYLLPAGGDDVETVQGDLTLGRATGDETFSPLFDPEAQESPEPGEIIYVNRQSQRVLCRRWSWRNAHFSRIQTDTQNVVINIDGLASVVDRDEMEKAAEEMAFLLLRFCHGMVSRWFLSEGHGSVEI